jgi:hypothetical protein
MTTDATATVVEILRAEHVTKLFGPVRALKDLRITHKCERDAEFSLVNR